MTRALLIDIGNSRIKWCPDDPARPAPGTSGTGLHDEAIAVADAASLALHWSSDDALEAAWISNVASPAVGDIVTGALRTNWPGIRIEAVRSTTREGDLVNGYGEPAQLGADRWMAAVGAHALLPTQDLLVCSFGTATTIDLVEGAATATARDARFVGGLILPGPETMRSALVTGTARLPDRVGRVVDFADNTDDAIVSGIVAAQVGAVMRALHDARNRLSGRALTLVVTGGGAPWIAPYLEGLDVASRPVANLVLRGLAVRARGGVVTYDADDAPIRAQPEIN